MNQNCYECDKKCETCIGDNKNCTMCNVKI